MCRTQLITAVAVLALLVRVAPVAADLSDSSADEHLLRSARLGTDGPALLEFFRARAGAEARRARIPALVKQLGATSVPAAEQAAAELVALGKTAIPDLKKAAQGANGGAAAGRARRCLEFLDGVSAPALPAAAARLLALRRPAGAAEVLLAYAPLADDATVTAEVRTALAFVGVVDGKPAPALLAASSDKDPLRRAVAAEVLCQTGAAGQGPAVRKLLEDQDPAVRLRVALALATTSAPEAVPVLIALLGELPPAQARQAEEALVQFAGDQSPAVGLGEDAAARRHCRDAWTAWWRGVDGTALLDYFRQRTLADTRRDKVRALVRRLGHSSFKMRRKAAADLAAFKNLAVPFLKEALTDPDLEVRRRAEQCLKRIQTMPEAPRSASNARLLALRRPAGAAETLLAYLPFADDDSVVEEVRRALATLAAAGGRPRQALLAVLDDQLPLRRQVAAEALCRVRPAPPPPAVRRLLQDAEAGVRLRVALALAARRDRHAIPVLIALLGELPQEQGWQAEEVLLRLAGTRAPVVSLGGDEASRRKCRAAWAAWWHEQQARVDLSRLDGPSRLLGYTLVAQWNNRDRVNDLIELGLDRKPRWRINGLQYSFDFEVLPGGRLLLAEHLGHRVVERNFKGQILWEYKINAPVNCHRLPNGNTFVTTPSFVVEVDRGKREVFKFARAGIMAGGKLPNGQVVIVTSAGMCIRLDSAGKELKSFSIGRMNNYGGVEVLPHGRVIVASYTLNKVVEYDADGKVRWQHAIPQPGFATRLANGNTLITSQGGQYAVEVNRGGKVVWEYRPGEAIWQARRR